MAVALTVVLGVASLALSGYQIYQSYDQAQDQKAQIRKNEARQKAIADKLKKAKMNAAKQDQVLAIVQNACLTNVVIDRISEHRDWYKKQYDTNGVASVTPKIPIEVLEVSDHYYGDPNQTYGYQYTSVYNSTTAPKVV